DTQKREAVIDFTGTSAQQTNNYNAPLAVCHAAVLYVFRTLVGTDIPLNAGCLKPLKIIAPENSMIHPKPPAAVISGNTEVSQAITDCLFGALGVIAGSQATMNNFVWGTEEFQNYDTICGGAGAGPDFPGASAVQIHMTNTRSTDPEVLEKRFPVRIEQFSIRRGSGGNGKFRGGDGCIRNMRALVPMKVTVLSSHRITQAFGLNGGEPGAVGINEVYRVDGTTVRLGGNDEIDLEAGDVFSVQTPGAGGSGKPTDPT
ncbi:MAG: hydantoinase B/oxoprolinase family protein, partial [Burkholderiaceae bacterium]